MGTYEVDEAEPVTADPDAEDLDADSAYDEDNASTYTESLRSSLLESLRENGRGYHKCMCLTASYYES